MRFSTQFTLWTGVSVKCRQNGNAKWKSRAITHSSTFWGLFFRGLKEKMCQDETRRSELHVLRNYEPTLQSEESLCKELFFLPSSLHYYDNTFISALVAGAVFSSEKPLQHWDNSSSVEPTRQSLHLSREINRKQPLRWVNLTEMQTLGWLSMHILMQK